MQITRAKRTALILLALCLLLALTACGGEVSPIDPIEKGDRYRDFTGELADGGTFRLSDHEGKVILLNFWATWCGPCVGEMPAFTWLVEKYGDRLALAAVNCEEDESTVRSFLSANGYTFPVVLDPKGEIGRGLYPSDGIPYTVIIAPDGTVAAIQTGASDAESMFLHYCELLDGILQ
jgi:thiol-disulfide isomerase/thioredoxin